ncbi:MAG: hypothetical protein Q9190_004320, partial [Brigantiaea leucoxantha]
HALYRFLATHSDRKLGAVTWEVNRATGIHAHWQLMPVPSDLVKKGLVEAAFKVEAENEKYPSFKEKEVGDGSGERGDFFRVWIWMPGEEDRNGGGSGGNGGEGSEAGEEEPRAKEKSLVLPISDEFRFDLQFGRKVMAKLLGLERRINWKDCTQTDKEEKRDAEAFKESFKRFDFSLGE